MCHILDEFASDYNESTFLANNYIYRQLWNGGSYQLVEILLVQSQQ